MAFPVSAGESTVEEASDHVELQERLQALIALLPEAAGADGDGQIILDFDLPDARYVLMRHPARHRNQCELSPREREIARMVAAGYPNKVIADVLEISAWTVCTYVRRMFAKLNVTSRAAMVARLHKDGVLG